ncbi:MAG: helicase associated domain-containing protein [Acidimicrobiales bacterium]
MSRTYRSPWSDAIWDARILELVAFLASHSGRYPSTASPDPIEHRLDDWVRHQRTFYRHGSLSLVRSRQLENVPGWSWEPWTVRWPRHLSDLLVFLASHAGRYPSRSATDPVERHLAGWVHGQKMSHKSGTLSPERTRQLEDLPGWSWARRTIPWNHRLADLVDFLSAQANRYPSAKSTGYGEASLAIWVNHQRESYRSGTLQPDRARLLKDIPGWTWGRGTTPRPAAGSGISAGKRSTP